MKDVIMHENQWWWGRSYTFIANDGKAMIELAIDETDGKDYFCTIQSLLVHESARHRGRANALLFQAEQYAGERIERQGDIRPPQRPLRPLRAYGAY